MSSRISACLQKLADENKKALAAFITAGDPNLASTPALMQALIAGGADIIELGVPFSDPLADGPTVQASSQRALQSGVSLAAILELVSRERAKISVPIVLMGYFNPIHHMGTDVFIQKAAAAGVDGVIVPDLPPEEGKDFYAACRAAGLDSILLAAPTTGEARIALLAESTSGFLYYVSVTGVTGARGELPPGIDARLRRVKEIVKTPMLVGFGISNGEQAAQVSKLADGVIVGSALVAIIAEHGENAAGPLQAKVREIKVGLG